MANGNTTSLSRKKAEITEQTYYRWRGEYGGLQVDQARRLKELELDNAKLKLLAGELSPEKLILKAICRLAASDAKAPKHWLHRGGVDTYCMLANCRR